MKQIRFQKKTGAGGFTLIEVLVVAALISMMAGIAIISVQYLMQQSKTKAATADARSLSDALSIVKMDLRFYPKLSYLSLPKMAIQQTVGQQQQILPDFDYIGFDNNQTGRVLLPHSKEILSKWNGPYLPSPSGRGITGTPHAGVCKMRMPYQPANTPAGDLYDWPSDPWGNPYVVYLAGTTTVNNVESPSWITNPYQDPVYFARVVSYGPNLIPGGGVNIVGDLPTAAAGPILQAAEPYKLFIRERNAQGDHFVMLLPAQYEGPPNRLAALRKDLGYLAGSPYAGQVPGIMDTGSDDLTVPLH